MGKKRSDSGKGKAAALVANGLNRGRKPRGRAGSNGGKAKTAKLSRLHKPEKMSLEAWQIALRRDFGVEQHFHFENLGQEPVFSEFRLTNPASGGIYRVAIRGEAPGCNFCSCPDYAVNTLGTCKHIEFLLARLRRRRGGAAALARGWQPPYSEVYLRYGAQREVIFGAAENCPPALRRLAAGYFDVQGALRPEAYRHFESFLAEGQAIAGKVGHVLRCYDDALGFIAQWRDSERRLREIEIAFPQGPDTPALQELLKVPLYPYQSRGALFAARAGRCLIADDMGLGKTIQAIAATEILARTAGIGRVLVVCPTSLKHQWQDEIAKFSKRPAVVVEGLAPARAECYRAESFFKITNYDVVHRDGEAIRHWEPDLIILDEAQRIKNWKTRTAQSVKKLNSEHAIVLTGTPLENRLEELHSIVEFVDRHRLGPLFRFLAEHQHVDEVGKVVGYRNLHAIAQTLAPLLLRRTKKEVLGELPERLDKTFFVPMTEQQMGLHEEHREIVARLVAKWRRYRFLSDADQRRLMIALQYMRMACDSTYLLDQKTDFGVKADELATQLEEIFERPEAKVVIFSQWLRMHELLVRRFESKRWSHVLFHGGVPGPQRRGLVRRFKEDPECRLFLATDSGGVGLNLQHASVVVNVDQPWNPAVLEQRIGRVHRLGQHRPVNVYHYVAKGTIEHGMLSLIDFKKSVFAGVLDGGGDEVFLGGPRLKRFMESVECATGEIPRPMPPQEPGAAAEAACVEPVGGNGAGKAAGAQADATPAAPAGQDLPWGELAAAGVVFLRKLGQALESGAGAGAERAGSTSGSADALGSLLARDSRGQPCLQIPVPSPDVLRDLAGLLMKLAGK